MLVTVNIVRIYKSQAYKATENEPNLPERTIALPERHLDDAGTTARATVHLGAPAPWVVEAASIRRLTGKISLNYLTGIAPPTDMEAAIDEALADGKMHPPFPEGYWYVTFIAQHDIEITAEEIGNTRFAWVTTALHHQAEQFRVSASAYLDELVVLASTEIATSAFEELVAGDWICFTAAGHTPFSMSEGRMSARLTVSRPPSELNLDGLERILQSSVTTSCAAQTWPRVVSPWWLAGLREEDTWKRFMQLFLALELLQEQLRDRYFERAKGNPRVEAANNSADFPHDEVTAALFKPGKKRQPSMAARGKQLRKVDDLGAPGEFASMALSLFPDDADADLVAANTIRRLRNDVAHGDRLIADTTFPVSELQMLLVRYMRAVANDHLL